MTTLDFFGRCPTCGYEFKQATLVTGKPTLEGANGICTRCGEIFKVEAAGKIRILTAKEFLHLHPADSINIALATANIDSRQAQEAAQRTARNN